MISRSSILIFHNHPYKNNRIKSMIQFIKKTLLLTICILIFPIFTQDKQTKKFYIAKSKQEGAFLYIDGYYKRDENGNLNLYGQVYHPEKEILIETFNLSNDLSGIEGNYPRPKRN